MSYDAFNFIILLACSLKRGDYRTQISFPVAALASEAFPDEAQLDCSSAAAGTQKHCAAAAGASTGVNDLQRLISRSSTQVRAARPSIANGHQARRYPVHVRRPHDAAIFAAPHAGSATARPVPKRGRGGDRRIGLKPARDVQCASHFFIGSKVIVVARLPKLSQVPANHTTVASGRDSFRRRKARSSAMRRLRLRSPST